MQGFKCLRLALTLAAVVLTGAAARGQGGAGAPPAASATAPGLAMAQTLSVVTGVAISPMLGVGAVGCYEYLKAKSPDERARLPWFARPLFWAPALLLVAACAAKDSAGVVLPPGLKKPFDALEVVEHKISGLVATGAFVPVMVNLLHPTGAAGGPAAASFGSLGLAVIDWHTAVYDTLLTPLMMAAFFMVFLASNAINIIILLSPFGALDAGLKAARTGLMASVAVTAWVHPWVGVVWSLFLVLFSYLIAGWSFRLSHFGLVFIWDYFTGRKHRFKPAPVVNTLFLARKINRVPARTCGKLERTASGDLLLRYRPWLVLPARTLALPPGVYAPGRGVFYSEILRVEGESAKTMLLLPPRYLGHEAALGKIYQMAAVRDTGIRAAWAWFKGLFGASRVAAA